MLVVTGLNIAFALLYSVIVPLYRGPDERQHVDMIRHYRAQAGEPAPNRAVRVDSVVQNVKRDGTLEHPDVVPKPLQTRDAMRRSKRPTFEKLGIPKVPKPNQMSQHPPLYYASIAAVSSFVTGVTPDSLWSYDREVYLYRLLSIIAVAPLALLASAAVLAMRCSKRIGVVAAAFTMLIPQKTFVGAVVNNDAFVMLFAAVSIVAGLRYLGGGPKRSAWLAAGAGAAVALTKATGATIAVWAVLVVAIGARERWKRGEQADAVAALRGALILAGLGGLWYLRNVIRYHNPQPSALKHPHATTGVRLSFVTFLPRWLARISQSFWGLPARRIGVGLPWWISHALSILTVAAIVFAVVAARTLWRYTLPLLALCVAQALLLLRSGYLANRFHLPGPEYAGVQGRYLFALIVPLAVLVAVAVGQLERRWPRVVSGVIAGEIAIGCALHLELASRMVARYWGIPGAGISEHLRAMLAWSPLPSPITVLLLALPILMIAVALVDGVLAVMTSRRSAS